MSWVSIDGLRVAYGEIGVLDGIRLSCARGSLVAVLGPSGCGKTTLLRAIAGLLPVDAGTISVGDRLLSSPTVQVAPEKRGMGWVPQDAALFPHLTVGDNIGFGLPRSTRDRAARVAELADVVGLGGFIDRAPSQLSGGQAQRVALARALAPEPALLLLDEPFAALDPLLRSSLRTEVAELLRARQCTTLLVTHDQEEALSLADYVAVMQNGRILQWGTPAEIYERPASCWVAGFVGDTVELDGVWEGDRVRCALGLIEAEPSDSTRPVTGGAVHLVLRPEWLRLDERGTDATVTAIAYAGHDALVSFELESGVGVRARIAAPDLPRRGDRVTLGLRQRALAFPAA
ncbi:MAG TPA: ABC transporter ATP-binding protein [Cryobacterium sp.]|nr:ABC transporter ATP-binding protein [Cryobacterium sp.]